MEITSVSSTSSTVTQPAIDASAASASAVATAANAQSSTQADTVSISSAAQSAATAQPEPFAQHADEFRSQTAIVLDTSGKYSQDEQLQAYNAVSKMAVTGQLRGAQGDDAKLWNEIGQSAIGQHVQQLQAQENQAITTAYQQGGTAAAAQAQNDYFSSLSEEDQKVHFSATVNPADYTGATRYKDVAQYKSVLQANVKVSNYVALSSASANDPSKITDPKAAALITLGNSRVDVATYLAKISELFGSNTDQDTTGGTAKLVSTGASSSSLFSSNLSAKILGSKISTTA